MNFLERLMSGHHSGDRIYMDYAAATPLRHEVWEAMRPIYKDVFGNPSGVHQEGQRARALIEKTREKIARLLTIRTEDVMFTSGGTEANNIAIAGVIEAAWADGQPYEEMEIITTKLEHPSLTETIKAYGDGAVTVHHAPVDEDGRIILSEFEKLLSEKTVLVATALINSEVGVIQPTRKLKKLMKEKGNAVLVVDGAQAPLWHPIQLEVLGADVLTLDAGKCYGPKGAGVIARRHGIALTPSIFGGGQEQGLRPGTENLAVIVGMGVALELAVVGVERRAEGVNELRDYFFASVEKELPDAVINGSRESGERAANNVNISLPGIDTEFAVVVLEEYGVAASTKSACSGAGGGESTVVKAMTSDAARAKSTLRFTLGETSSKQQVDQVVAILKQHVAKMQKIDSE